MSPATRIKRPASPSPAPRKRIKQGLSSIFPRTSKISPIVIDDDSSSDSDDPNDQLSSLRQEVNDINAMIKEAEKRHKVNHGERELAEQELATKHHLEEHAEREAMLRLQNLQKKASDRLRRQMRDTIHASRSRPLRIRTTVSVQIPAKPLKVEDDSNFGEHNRGGTLQPSSNVPRQASLLGSSSRLSSVSTLAPSLPPPPSTRPTSRSSNENRSFAKSDQSQKKQGTADRLSKPTPKRREHSEESSANEYEWVARPEDDDENYMELDGSDDGAPRRTLRTSHDTFEDVNDEDDSDIVPTPRRRRARVTENSQDPEDNDSTICMAETRPIGTRLSQTGHGREVKKSRKLSKKAAAAVPRIEMPAYILGLNNDYHHKLPLPETSVKFSSEFLSAFIGGGKEATYVSIGTAKKKGQIYPVDKYFAFNPEYNPQAPQAAGRHGAGLCVGTLGCKPGQTDLDEDEHGGSALQEMVHYFVRRRATEYEYCGQYVQGRHYEKLTPEEINIHVSDETRDHWAHKITTSKWGFGLLVRSGAANTIEHAQTFTSLQVKALFNKFDDATGAKLRFYWKYMECCDYDIEFYEALCKKGREIGWTTRSGPHIENNFGVNAAISTAVPKDETIISSAGVVEEEDEDAGLGDEDDDDRSSLRNRVPPPRMPGYIRSLNNDYYHKLPLPDTSVKFSRKFLSTYIGGGGRQTYCIVSPEKKKNQIYDINKYGCFSPKYAPYVPPSAGKHGAGLAIGSYDRKPYEVYDEREDREESLQTPIHWFVKRQPTEWEYCGIYVQGRNFEKLTPQELKIYISDTTKNFWADKIVSRGWGSQCLIETGVAGDRRHAETFTMEQVLALFNKPDNAPGVKLRFYWQYMECCDYDRDFYEALKKKGLEVGWTTRFNPYLDNNFGTNAAHATVVKEESPSSVDRDNVQIISDVSDGDGERNRSSSSSPRRVQTSRASPVAQKEKSRTKKPIAVPRIQMPAYILSLNNDYHHKLPLPDTSIKFSRRFLSRFIGGGEQGTFVNVSDAKKKTQIYPIDRYAGFHTDWNPQAPQSAGMHGAGFSIGLMDTKSGGPVGVDDEVCPKTGENSLQEGTHYFVYRRDTEWEYCGLYVQGRKFEKLTLEEYNLHVLEDVRNLWAEKICAKDWGHRVLVDCGAAKTKEEAMKFTARQVRKFMDCPDDKPGIKLRFYWLYMECVDYDLDFYQALAKKGLQVGWTTRENPDKPNRYGLNADMPTALLEDQDDGDLYN